MNEPSKQHYTWSQIDLVCNLLHEKIIGDKFFPSYIIGLTRGGLIPATILSHKLSCPLYPFNLSLRDHIRTDTKEWMAIDALTHKNILVVDDINDTGATFDTFKKQWEAFKDGNWNKIWHNNVRFAVIDHNLVSKSKIDYCGNILNKSINDVWIVYPWEN